MEECGCTGVKPISWDGVCEMMSTFGRLGAIWEYNIILIIYHQVLAPLIFGRKGKHNNSKTLFLFDRQQNHELINAITNNLKTMLNSNLFQESSFNRLRWPIIQTYQATFLHSNNHSTWKQHYYTIKILSPI